MEKEPRSQHDRDVDILDTTLHLDLFIPHMTPEILLYKTDDRILHGSTSGLLDTEVQSCNVSAREARGGLMGGSICFQDQAPICEIKEKQNDSGKMLGTNNSNPYPHSLLLQGNAKNTNQLLIKNDKLLCPHC